MHHFQIIERTPYSSGTCTTFHSLEWAMSAVSTSAFRMHDACVWVVIRIRNNKRIEDVKLWRKLDPSPMSRPVQISRSHVPVDNFAKESISKDKKKMLFASSSSFNVQKETPIKKATFEICKKASVYSIQLPDYTPFVAHIKRIQFVSQNVAVRFPFAAGIWRHCGLGINWKTFEANENCWQNFVSFIELYI